MNNRQRLAVLTLALLLLVAASTACIITGGGEATSAKQTAAAQTAQAGAPTATYGAQQFHLQQTAWAEP